MFSLSWGHACKIEKQLKEEVDSLLRQAELADQSTIPDGMSIPAQAQPSGLRLHDDDDRDHGSAAPHERDHDRDHLINMNMIIALARFAEHSPALS